MSQPSKPRRTHIKSKSGCSTCKKRRVRCDEFKPECINCHRLNLHCGYLEDTTTASELIQQAPQLLELDAPLIVSLQQFPDFAQRDRYYFSHLAGQIDELQRKDIHLLAFGTALLPELLKLGTNFEHVRHCLCALSAAQLARATKSASITYVEYQYRGLGLRSLRESLVNPSKEQLEGVLAASLLLSWGALESDEYMHTMQGVYLTIKEMESSSHTSALRSLMQASHDSAVPALPQPASTVRSLEIAFEALIDLQKRLSKDHKDQELIRGVKELCNYVSNMRAVAETRTSTTAQLEALFPIRNWILWMPNALVRLGQRDPFTMLFFAYYEMVHLAIVPLLPAVSTPLAVGKRVEFIERLDAQLMNICVGPGDASSNTLHDWNELMFAPRAYALVYRQRSTSAQGMVIR